MKNIFLLLTVIACMTACKNESTSTSEENTEVTTETPAVTGTKKEYPDNIAAIFEAHGGIDRWNELNNLCFEMEGRGGVEVHTTSLKDRKAKIENKNWTIGYDGSDVWLLQNKDEAYKGNARFYHNLMFYFYAMPFIVGDDGIRYEDVPARELDGVMYPGVKISYGDGVGDSPEDEYIVFYDDATKQMKWLGYTVTYRTQEKSDKWSFIKYADWQNVNGLQLPSKLTWYNVEEGKPTTQRNDMLFTKVTATETVLGAAVFEKPENAEVSEK